MFKSANAFHTLIALALVGLIVMAWAKEGSHFAIALTAFAIITGVVPIVLLRGSRARQRRKDRS